MLLAVHGRLSLLVTALVDGDATGAAAIEQIDCAWKNRTREQMAKEINKFLFLHGIDGDSMVARVTMTSLSSLFIIHFH